MIRESRKFWKGCDFTVPCCTNKNLQNILEDVPSSYVTQQKIPKKKAHFPVYFADFYLYSKVP